MAYRKEYPKNLEFKFSNAVLYVYSASKTHHNSDLWSIKYLFEEGKTDLPANICINGEISETMDLRMYFLKYLFPNIEFHDAKGDMYRTVAEEIIRKVGTKEYITYNFKDYHFNNRGTKDKLESRIEEELANNLSKYIFDFSAELKPVRQFPANIFDKKISEKNRITDKLWIDIVSVNTDHELSPIELKVGNNRSFDFFTQGFDYGIYCHLFKQYIKKRWFSEYSGIKQNKITIYYVGEDFHPALIGRRGKKGVVSLIRKNELFNIVFVKIKVNKSSRCIINSEIIFDTRNS